MRKLVVAGNWKMYKNRDDALSYIYDVNTKLPSNEIVDTILFTPSIYLRSLVKRQEEYLKIGAQNMHESDNGAFTGEISANMLTNIGVSYVLIGHSERRQYFNETDNSVNLKIKQALNNSLTPMLCVGESLDIRKANKTDEFVSNQVVKALKDIDSNQVLKIEIAYEPIWAIGTGVTATAEQANDTICDIRKTIEKLYSKEVAEKVRILYGGSVKVDNIEEILSKKDIDGALIGGASLDSASFLKMANIAAKIKK